MGTFRCWPPPFLPLTLTNYYLSHNHCGTEFKNHHPPSGLSQTRRFDPYTHLALTQQASQQPTKNKGGFMPYGNCYIASIELQHSHLFIWSVVAPPTPSDLSQPDF